MILKSSLSSGPPERPCQKPAAFKIVGRTDAGGEHLLRQLASRARGGGVVTLHGAEAFRGFVQGAEEAQASAGRQVVLDPGGLDHARAPAGQVADGAVAHPSRTRTDVRGLGAPELPP